MKILLVEEQIIPNWARKMGINRCFIYNGESMLPLFHPGDLLYSRTSPDHLQLGQIVVFRDPDDAGYTVHRLIKRSLTSWETKGDNNSFKDQWLRTDQIIARVEYYNHAGKIYEVHNGGWELSLWNIYKRSFASFMQFLKILGSPYRWLRRKKLLSYVWHPKLTYLLISTDHGNVIKIVFGKKVIARYWPQKDNFECRKPYDLVISKDDVKKFLRQS